MTRDPFDRLASVPEASATAPSSAPSPRPGGASPDDPAADVGPSASADVEGAALNARRGGQGPRLVVLHGLFGDLANFHSVALHLARHVEVCRIDLPGHGASPTLPRLGIEDMAARVHAWMERESIGRCHLLGHSLGGKVAMALAGFEDGPELASLTVVDIAPRHYPPHHVPIIEALGAIDLDALDARSDADRQLRDGVPDAGVRAFLLKGLTRDGDGRFRWRFDLEGIARDYPLMSEAPRVARTIAAPTLFVKGGESDYLGPDDEGPIRAICREPTFREIAGTGHWPHAEKPDLFTRVVLDFVRKAETGGDAPA